MSTFGSKNLQAKFLFGLTAIVLLLGVFLAGGLYFYLRSLLDSQVKDKAALVFSQVSSVQKYVRDTLRPKMFATLPEGEFVIEAMSSSYISRAIMDRLNLPSSEYLYRRVAENARNPMYEINDEERSLLDYFRDNPHEEFWVGYRKVDGKKCFTKARPVVFQQSCLTCHGVPDDSPTVLIERYGRDRGFGHTLSSTDGLVVVGVPVEGAVNKIHEAMIGYVALYGGGMVVFFAIVRLFFNRLVMQNLERLTDKFRTLFHEEAEFGIMKKLEEGDEIEEVVQGLEELGDHLHEVHYQLRQHTENLEHLVEVRTHELKWEADERSSDVSLFVQLLNGLNKSQSRQEMWLYSLPLIAQRFKTREVSFLCMLESQSFYTWPLDSPKPELPPNWKDIMVDGKPYYTDNKAYIPVAASIKSSEGILCLNWDKETRNKEQDRNVMRALGQQLGIAMENLSALYNLLRQKEMLQGIVEGISDPLLLMDGACTVVLANEAARSLSRSFGASISDGYCPGLFKRGGVLHSCPLPEALEGGTTMSQEVETSDGRFFSINVFPVAEGVAEKGRGVVYIRDVTQDKKMLDTMQQSEKLATVGQLAAGLAHEMNNPLGVIKCYAELLKGAEVGSEVTSDAEIILKHVSQAQQVLQDLLNFARPKRMEPVRLDIGKIVTHSINVFRIQAEKKGVEVSRKVDETLPPIIANEHFVEQILANLLKNALDAVNANTGRIQVEATQDSELDMIVIRVADNGPGIPEEDIRSLFDPFFTTKEVGKGTGLGLTVVYGLVQEMGGSILIENAGGVVCTVHLPIDNQEKERE